MAGGSELARRFGKNLARARRDAGLSQEEAGIRASLHRTEIGLLERGERIPRIDTMLKLAGALGVKIACPLFEGIGWDSGFARPGEFVVDERGKGGEEAPAGPGG